MDFWDFEKQYRDSLVPTETAGAKTPAKSDKWDKAKEDEIKDDKPAEKPAENTTEKPAEPAEQPAEPAESESENNG